MLDLKGQDVIDTDNFRACSCCGKVSSKIYVFNSGDNYACSDKCRDNISEMTYNANWEELSTIYNEDEDEFETDPDFYYTEL